MFDHGPAVAALARLVESVRDEQLGDPTPCASFTVADLLDDVSGFAAAFTANARKQELPAAAARPVDGRRLPVDWRTSVPGQLAEMAAAWRHESAWTGQVSAGGLEMPAEHNALVVIEETVMHGWDLARASGQDFAPDEEWLVGVDLFFEAFAEPITSGQGPYGPAIAVPEDASHLHRLLGAAGRDPGWRPTR